MHGLIFETSVCYWQNQPGYYLYMSVRRTLSVTKSDGTFSVRELPHEWRGKKIPPSSSFYFVQSSHSHQLWSECFPTSLSSSEELTSPEFRRSEGYIFSHNRLWTVYSFKERVVSVRIFLASHSISNDASSTSHFKSPLQSQSKCRLDLIKRCQQNCQHHNWSCSYVRQITWAISSIVLCQRLSSLPWYRQTPKN